MIPPSRPSSSPPLSSPRLPSRLLSYPPLPPSPPLGYSTLPTLPSLSSLPTYSTFPTLLYSPLPSHRIASLPLRLLPSPSLPDPLSYPVPPSLNQCPSPPRPYFTFPYHIIPSYHLPYATLPSPPLPFATFAVCPWVCLSVRTYQQVWQAERRTATHTARMYS